MKIKVKGVLLILIVFLSVFSGYLAMKESSGSTVCLTGNDYSDCESVQSSKYGKILGIKVSTLGPVAYLLLLVAYLLSYSNYKYRENYREIYQIMVSIGVLFAFYFLYIQFFVLYQICSTCLVLDLGTILVGVLSFVEYKRHE
jgi:uncharacterized membrane protein